MQKKDVERRFAHLRKIQLRNTASRFRFQALLQKYTTYLTYWQRITRQIEEGTYRRDFARARGYGRIPSKDGAEARTDDTDAEVSFEESDDVDAIVAEAERAVTTGAPVPTARERIVEHIELPDRESIPPTMPTPVSPAAAATPAKPGAIPAKPATPIARRAGLSVFGAAPGAKTVSPAQKTAAPPKPALPSKPATAPAAPPAAARPAPPSPSASPAPSAPMPPKPAAQSAPDEPRIRELFDRYSQSRKQTGEGEVTFDAVARQVRDTLPKLAEKYPGADVSIDVAVKDGRTVLRPVVRKK